MDNFDKKIAEIVNEYFNENKNTLSFGKSIYFGNRKASINAEDIKRTKDNEKKK